jgi:hypothetical protein
VSVAEREKREVQHKELDKKNASPMYLGNKDKKEIDERMNQDLGSCVRRKEKE